MVLLLFIFRKEERMYKMQSLIQYVIVSCLTPALSCDSVMEVVDSRDVLITDTQYYTTDEDRWCWASLFQKQAKTWYKSKKTNGPLSMGKAWVWTHKHSPIPQHPLPHQTTAIHKMEWSFGVFLKGYSGSQCLISDFLFSYFSPEFLKQCRGLASWIFQDPVLPNGNLLKGTKRKYC